MDGVSGVTALYDWLEMSASPQHRSFGALDAGNAASRNGTIESITGICDVRVIFPSFDELTQELATQSCGEETVWKLDDNAGRDQRSTFEEVDRALLPSETLCEFPILATPVRAHADPGFNRI